MELIDLFAAAQVQLYIHGQFPAEAAYEFASLASGHELSTLYSYFFNCLSFQGCH